jgi:hypothetical protein
MSEHSQKGFELKGWLCLTLIFAAAILGSVLAVEAQVSDPIVGKPAPQTLRPKIKSITQIEPSSVSRWQFMQRYNPGIIGGHDGVWVLDTMTGFVKHCRREVRFVVCTDIVERLNQGK